MSASLLRPQNQFSNTQIKVQMNLTTFYIFRQRKIKYKKMSIIFQLYDGGYPNIDALDGSPEMLEEAKRKDIYRRIICDYLGPNRLDIEDGKFCVNNFPLF